MLACSRYQCTSIGNLRSQMGTWCSGITSASHAEGPGFKSRCVQSSGSPVESERGDQSLCKLTGMVLVRWQGAASVRMKDFARDLGSGHSHGCANPPCTAPHAITLPHAAHPLHPTTLHCAARKTAGHCPRRICTARPSTALAKTTLPCTGLHRTPRHCTRSRGNSVHSTAWH